MLIPHGPYALVGNPNQPDGLRMKHTGDLTPEEAAQVGLPHHTRDPAPRDAAAAVERVRNQSKSVSPTKPCASTPGGHAKVAVES
jgi:hypothetical protein